MQHIFLLTYKTFFTQVEHMTRHDQRTVHRWVCVFSFGCFALICDGWKKARWPFQIYSLSNVFSWPAVGHLYAPSRPGSRAGHGRHTGTDVTPGLCDLCCGGDLLVSKQHACPWCPLQIQECVCVCACVHACVQASVAGSAWVLLLM